MAPSNDVDKLDQERLLNKWRWLCSQPLTIIDRNAFGDLFLLDGSGRVYMLDVGSGEFTSIAASVSEFNKLADTPEKRQEWFEEESTNAAAERGLVPGSEQCIGFRIPVVFEEGGGLDSAYIADIYEHLGFLGDLHRQIASMPDGTKVKLIISNLKKDDG
jgi:hypothetical protein